jgi:hypothetical protein
MCLPVFFCEALELTDSLSMNGSQILVPAGEYTLGGRTLTVGQKAQFVVMDVPSVRITNEERMLPNSPLNSGKHNGDGRLSKLRVSGITAYGSLDPESIVVTRRDQATLKEGVDYIVEKLWGRIVLGPSSTVTDSERILVSYTYRHQRIDTVAIDPSGELFYLYGKDEFLAPRPPVLPDGHVGLFNVYRPYDSSAVLKEHIFPIQKTSTDVKTGSTAGRIPKTRAKLEAGEPVVIVCWGDSVTVGADLSSLQDRYSDQLEKQLNDKFPQAHIAITNISIGGTRSSFWMQGLDKGETQGCTFARIIDAKPDLVIMEFVNDAGLPEEQLERLYNRILAEMSSLKSELILITPHFTHPDNKMGTHDLRTRDTRPYVQFLKCFSEKHLIALADASARWENLWREGLPYTTLLANGWNHPDNRGHALFTTEIIKCFD